MQSGDNLHSETVINDLDDFPFLFNSNGQYWLIVHQNMSSLRTNFNLLVSHMEAFNFRPKIILITKIQINSYEIHNYPSPNYDFLVLWNGSCASDGCWSFVDSSHSTILQKIEATTFDMFRLTYKDQISMLQIIARKLDNNVGGTGTSFVDSYLSLLPKYGIT